MLRLYGALIGLSLIWGLSFVFMKWLLHQRAFGDCVSPLFSGCSCSASRFMVEAQGNQLEITMESTGCCRNLQLRISMGINSFK